MKLAIVNILPCLRRHGSRLSPQLVAVFAGNFCKVASHDIRVKILRGLAYFLNDRKVDIQFQGCIRFIILLMMDHVRGKNGTDIQGEIHLILDVMESLAT